MEKTDERLEYLTAKEIFNRILNLGLIFKNGSFYYCTCSGFVNIKLIMTQWS